MEGHIVRTFDGDILDLRLQVLAMGGLAIEQVRAAATALTAGDEVAAREVVARSAAVTAAARAIDEEIVALIARRQPVATDLRAVLGAGRVALDLERVGTCARRIARLASELNATPLDPEFGRFHHGVRKMTRFAVAMLRDALDCFDRVDLDGAAAVVVRDSELDAEFQLAVRDQMTYVLEDPRHLRSTLQSVFVLKALERVGDLASAIATETRRVARPDPARAGSVPAASA